MRSLPVIILLSFTILGCDGGDSGEFGYGTSGGSGDVVNFSFDCNSPEVICDGAEIVNRHYHNTYEINCASELIRGRCAVDERHWNRLRMVRIYGRIKT